ncbi:DUF4102 domain-containing protein [Bartonella massiliensis]|uniref:DUF4102 domain-containing protein n=1 Tax=Bartonella massiliensis TaxID=929795 RepID=UPI001FEA4A59|nr:DUF4102 domain-containing protein [Bartonella massiliensis]
MNRLKCQGLLQYFRTGKYNDDAGFLFHKHKNRELNRFILLGLYRYTIHSRRRKMGGISWEMPL